MVEPVPFDLEAEKSVLGSMLRDPQCASEVVAQVTKDDFYSPRHRDLFAVAEALDEKSSGSCDAVTVAHELERLGRSEELGGRAYLAELMETVPSIAFLENHLRIVRDLAVRRALLKAAERIQRDAVENAGDVRDLVDQAEQSVMRVGDRLVQVRAQAAKDVIREEIDRILRQDTGPQGLVTGYVDLDECQGFRPGDLVVLAARPSMGKTALALNMLERLALKSEKAILLFSLEMPAEQIVLRLLASHARVNHHGLRQGRLGQAERSRLTHSAGEFSTARIFIDDSSQPSMAELRAKARRLKREGSLDLIILDYLQLLHLPGFERNRQQEIASISRNLKAMARELKVPVLALSQLNREAEKDSRPKLSHLRESGAIEQDADMVMLLHREEFLNPTSENAGMAELFVAKNRNGPTKDLVFHFTKELMRFENAVREPAF